MRNLILLLLSALTLNAATGNIKWATVETNGWVLQVCFDTLGTNGTFNFGWGTNNTGTSKVTLSLTSLGYDDLGQSTTSVRTVYGTKQLRFPWPANAFPDIQIVGADVVVRTGLSDYVFASDSNLTVNIQANWYSNNAAATGLSATNNSILPHPRCIVNWSWPGWQRITSNTMTLRAVGFHKSAQQGRPLRVLRFTAADRHSHTNTAWVTRMSIDTNLLDASIICEYVTNMDISTFSNGDPIRCDFTAYPWVGDTNAVLDTFDNVNHQPTPLWASITNFCDRTLAYYGPNGAWALVATDGNDSTGRAQTNVLNIGSPPPAFLTINGALVSIKATNNAFFGHNDVGGGTVYLNSGAYNWTGGSGSFNSATPCWVTVTRWPTNTVQDVAIADTSGNKFIGWNDHLQGITLAAVTASGCFSGSTNLWLDRCVIQSASGTPFYNNRQWYLTQCTISNLFQGIRPPSTINSACALLRGSELQTLGDSILVYTVLGNKRTVTNTVGTGNKNLFVSEYLAQRTPRCDGSILAFNQVLGWYSVSEALFYFQNTNQVFGTAIVQNMFENMSATLTTSLVRMAGDASTSDNICNILHWNNSETGQRHNGPYDTEGSTGTKYRTLWSAKNNIMDSCNVKCDVFGGQQNSNHIGNWSYIWGTAQSGSFLGPVAGISITFTHENSGGMPGLNTYQVTNSNLGYNTQQYAAPASYNGTNSGTGFGNYRMAQASWIRRWGCEQLLPYDLAGNPRTTNDPPGIYGELTYAPYPGNIVNLIMTNVAPITITLTNGAAVTINLNTNL